MAPAVIFLVATIGLSPPCEVILRRVDNAVSDRDPLAASLRSPLHDLRQPSGFNELFQVEGRDIFVRRSGAVWATFPRGSYRAHDGRLVVEAPAGMTFSIGPPQRLLDPLAGWHADAAMGDDRPQALPAMALGVPSPERLDRRMDLSIASTVQGAVSEGPTAPRPEADASAPSTPEIAWPQAATTSGDPAPPRFVADETYRRERLALVAAALRESR